MAGRADLFHGVTIQQNKNFVEYRGGLQSNMDYRTEAPAIIRDFLVYHETIQGHSRKTADEYYLDLRNFFRFMKMEKGKAPRSAELDEIAIDDVDLDLVR